MVAINIEAVRAHLERRSPFPKGGGKGGSSGSGGSKSSSSSSKSRVTSTHRGNTYVAGSGGSGGSGLPVWAIVLIVVLIALLILLLAFCVGRHRKQKKKLSEANESKTAENSPLVGDTYIHAAGDGYRNDDASAAATTPTKMSHSSLNPTSIMLTAPAPVVGGSNVDYYTPAPAAGGSNANYYGSPSPPYDSTSRPKA